MLNRDAVRVLLAGCGTVVPDTWFHPGFVARVERTRRELAEVCGQGLRHDGVDVVVGAPRELRRKRVRRCRPVPTPNR